VSDNIAVIGSGFGGLSTAILLADLGYRVTVVEASPLLGGCLRSYRRHGVDCPVGVHYFGSAEPGQLLGDFFDLLQIRDVLKLRRLGKGGVIDRFIFPDEVFDLPDTADKLEVALARRFPDAPDAVAFVMKVCRAAMASLMTANASTMAPPLPITKTAAQVLGEMNLPKRLVDLLALQGFLLGVNLSVCPASFLMMATASLLMSAWELGCTGADMAQALVARARAAGVDMIAGDAVAAIEVRDQRACGLRLASGATITANAVVAGIHPKTLVGMLPDGAVPDGYRSGITRLHETDGTLCVEALLDERIHPAHDYNLFRIVGDPSRRLAGVYGQFRPSGRPGLTRLTAIAESHYDDWKPWHATTTGKRGPAYEAEKDRRARQALAELAATIGPIHDPTIIDVWTPLTMRDWVGAPEGGTYGVRHSIRDGLDYLVLSRPPVRGLFLVGQNAIAPGLLGVAMGVLRTVNVLAGREATAKLFAKHCQARAEHPA
jgi:all-trans-retinol 13,14-reductase